METSSDLTEPDRPAPGPPLFNFGQGLVFVLGAIVGNVAIFAYARYGPGGGTFVSRLTLATMVALVLWCLGVAACGVRFLWCQRQESLRRKYAERAASDAALAFLDTVASPDADKWQTPQINPSNL